MKIHNEGGSGPLTGPGAASPKTPASKRTGGNPPEAPAPVADSVTTSEVATSLEVDQQRAARVERLREQFLSGTYSVDARELSRRLIDAHLSEPSTGTTGRRTTPDAGPEIP